MLELQGIPLLELPQELLAELLSYLDYQSLLRCCMTCHTLRDLCSHFSELQAILELGADGLATLGHNLSNTELLASIRNRRRAWMEMNFKNPPSILKLNGETRAYEVVAGVYCQIDDTHLAVVKLEGNMQPVVSKLGIERVRDFAMDPTQDIIALVRDLPISGLPGSRQLEVHLRTLSSNRPYNSDKPLTATLPPIMLNPPGNSTRSVAIQLIDDVLAVFVKLGYVNERLIAWFWKDGTVAFDLDERHSLPTTHGDWTMLSPRTFAFTCTSLSKSGSVQVFSFDRGSPPQLVGNFGLPKVSQHGTIHSMTIHAGPFCANLPTTDLFASNWRRHMVVLELDYLTTDPHIDCSFLLCVRNDTILDRLSTNINEDSSELPWLKWGSGKALIYPIASHEEAYRWMRYVHGQRVILPYKENASEVTVLDFSQGAAQMDQTTINTPVVTSFTVPEPGEAVGYAGPLFVDEFLEGLPYRKTTRKLPSATGYAGFMIDEKRILSLETGAIGPLSVDLNVFEVC